MTCHPRLGGALEEGGGHRNYTYCLFFYYILPEEIIEWITTGVDFCYHLVEVTT